MSIYPVRMVVWFPIEDEHYYSAYAIVTLSRCFACGKRPNYKRAVAMHSAPWGSGEIWCSWRCCNSGKEYRLDKRQRRKVRRQIKAYEEEGHYVRMY